MCETLFAPPWALQRHRSGPVAVERTASLAQLAAQGTARTTWQRRAHDGLHVARELAHWPSHHRFTPAALETMATAWAAPSVANGRASPPKHPQGMFRMAAAAFLRLLDRFCINPVSPPGRYAERLEAFIQEQRQYRWPSAETCRVGCGPVVAFLADLEEHGGELARIAAGDGDGYCPHLARRLSRTTLRNGATGLRAWCRCCATPGWTPPGLAAAILLPHIARHERLPLGPTWDQGRRRIDAASGEEPARLRTRAMLLLLSVYGRRSGAVRRWQLDAVDWQHDRLRLPRSKSMRLAMCPLEPRVGHALAGDVRHGRPPRHRRTL